MKKVLLFFAICLFLFASNVFCQNSNSKQLVDAFRKADLVKLEELANQGAKLTSESRDELWLSGTYVDQIEVKALATGDIKTLKILKQLGVDFNNFVFDGSFTYPITLAAFARQIKTMNFLLSDGIDYRYSLPSTSTYAELDRRLSSSNNSDTKDFCKVFISCKDLFGEISGNLIRGYLPYPDRVVSTNELIQVLKTIMRHAVEVNDTDYIDNITTRFKLAKNANYNKQYNDDREVIQGVQVIHEILVDARQWAAHKGKGNSDIYKTLYKATLN